MKLKNAILILLALFILNSTATAMTPTCIAKWYQKDNDTFKNGMTETTYAFGDYEYVKVSSNKAICGNDRAEKNNGPMLVFMQYDDITILTFQKFSRGKLEMVTSWDSRYPLRHEDVQLNDWQSTIFDNNIEIFEKHAPLYLKIVNETKVAKEKLRDEAQALLDKEKAVQKEIEDTKQKEINRVAIAELLNTIAKMNAGQLFAKADELSSQGDKVKAREVLRSLVSRFPDHPLAATAAQQMTTMANAE
jgi:hypothetical protein